MKLGYARVSTKNQSLDSQIDLLNSAGCERIYSEHVSGVSKARAEFDSLTKAIRTGDVVVVCSLDRLARSLKELVSIIEGFNKDNVSFISLRENIDTSTTTGRFFFHVFAAISEFERELIRERTNAGLAAAKARGRSGGRPKSLSDKQREMVKELLKTQTYTSVAEQFNVSKATIYRVVADD